MLRVLTIALVVVGILTTLTAAVPIQASTIGDCPEGFVPATPPLNPQLGCVPERMASDPGVQPDLGSPETTGGGNEGVQPVEICNNGIDDDRDGIVDEDDCLCPPNRTCPPLVEEESALQEQETPPDRGIPPETTGGENEDIGSTLSAAPVDEGDDEDGEENGNDRGGSEDVIQ